MSSRALEALIVLLAVVTLLSFGGGWRWWLELLTHFRFHGLLAGTSGAAAALLLGKRRWALLSLGLAVVHGYYVAPLYISATPAASKATAGGATPGLRLLVANVRTQNRNHQALLDLVEQERPDLLLVLETDTRWVRALEAGLAAYPFQVADPRSDNFGIALFSRLPLAGSFLRSFGQAELPTIEVEFRWDGAPLRLFVTHPVPPLGSRNLAARDDQLAKLAAAVRAVEGSAIVGGDLNVTTYAPAFREFLAESGLRDSGRGYGLQTTWPSRLPFWLRIGIDHVLHTGDLAVVSRRVLGGIGSDHLPVWIELRRR